MDYAAFCKQFFSATGIPTVLFFEERLVYCALADVLSIQALDAWTIYTPTKNPEFSCINPDLEYGHVRIEGTGYDLFIGPLFTVPVTKELAREFMEDSKVSPDHWEAVEELLYALPSGSHPQFVRYLRFLHQCLNGADAAEEDFFTEGDSSAVNREMRALYTAIEAKENTSAHNSYDFERKLYRLIQLGDTNRLKAFLEKTRDFPREGRVARTPLRQAKNILIGVAEKAGLLGAIPGGVDIERVYQLIDLYICECEQMQTVDEVRRLQYIMLMDFCQRAGTAKLPKGVSAEIRQCMDYIQSHTNMTITVEEVAKQIHCSSSSLMRRFKAETGMKVGDYVAKCKMEEACDLLVYGERSLAEISAYLGYSSQSYFQNVFKKQYGITPMQYRKQNRQ
jgi:AraC-like DNA-binding protein